MDVGSEQRVFEGGEGNQLSADCYGDPQLQPVLLLHGAGQTRHAWGSTARILGQKGWYAVAMDMRGHGDSDWHPQGEYSIPQYANDLQSVCDQLGQKPALVGASLGGITALVAAESSVPYSSLILVDVTPSLEFKGVERILQFMRAHLDGFASLDDAAQAVADYLPARKPNGQAGLQKNLRLRRDGRYYWHWDPRLLDHVGHFQPEDSQRLRAAAARLCVPTLIVRGRMSDVVSQASVDEFLALVPHAEYLDVGSAGHMVAGDSNDAFTESVAGFLANTR